MRPRPATVPAAAARSASASAARSSSASAWPTSTSAGSVSRTPRPARSSSGTPASRSSIASCCETAEGVNWSASATAAIVPRSLQLAQQAEAAKVEHRSGTLPNLRQESESILMLRSGTMRAVRSSGTLMCLASAAAFGAMAVFGKLAYDEGATVGTLLAVRFTLAARAVLGPARWRAARRASCARLRRRDVAAGLGARRLRLRARRRAATSPRSSASTRRCSRCCSTRSRDRRRRRGRARPRALRRAGASARSALALGGHRARAWPARARARSSRWAPRSALGAALVYSTYILISDGIVRRASPRVLLAALVCTGAAVTLTAGSRAARRAAARAR